MQPANFFLSLGGLLFFLASHAQQPENTSSAQASTRVNTIFRQLMPPCDPISFQTTHRLCPGDSVFLSGAWQHLPGIYLDTFVASNGCDSVVTTIVDPITLDLTVSHTDAICTFGSAHVDVTGEGPFAFLWNDPWLQDTPQAIGLEAGNYIVEVTDGNGCTKTASVEIASAPACPGDYNHDATVGISDYMIFIQNYGCLENCCPYDFDGDDIVGVFDLLKFMGYFGVSCSGS